MKVPRNAIATTSWYTANTAPSRASISPSLTPSALKAPTRTPPADRAFPTAATIPDAQPALRLTAPPKAADSAPCPPAQSPANIVNAAVATSCHRRTVRIALLNNRGLAFTFSTPCKAAKVYAVRARWVNVLQRKILSRFPARPVCVSEAFSTADPDDRAPNS